MKDYVVVFDAEGVDSWKEMANVDKEFFVQVMSRADDGITVITKNAFKKGFLEVWTPKALLQEISTCNKKTSDDEEPVEIEVTTAEKGKTVTQAIDSQEGVDQVLQESKAWQLPYQPYKQSLSTFHEAHKEHFKMGALLPFSEMDLMRWVSTVSCSWRHGEE